jgi:hypothetical protein
MPVLTPAVRAAACAVVSAALLLACQPVDPDLAGPGAESPTAAAGPDVAGGAQVADDLTALLAEHAGTAAQWQAGATPVEIVTQLEDGRWRSAAITYLAPEADRFLLVRTGPDGTSQERPTLEALGIAAIPELALAQVPPLPELAQPPVALVARAEPALASCEIDGDVAVVLYATGAPAAWDGDRWTEEPRWTATLSGGEAGAVVVDPVTGGPVGRGCLPPAGG